jgi:hypothetical protein
VIAVDGDAGPRNVHGSGIKNGYGADGSGGTQKFPALDCGLIVRGESCRNVRRRAGEIDDDFAFQVEAGELIEIFFRDLEAVSDEDERRGEICGRACSTRTDEGIVSKGERLGLAAGSEGQRRLGFIDLELIETDRLEKAVDAGGLEAGFLELFDGVSLGFAKAFAAGVAPFQRIVGKKFDVRPPGVAIKVRHSRILLGRGRGGRSEQENHRKRVTHEIHLTKQVERLEDSRVAGKESREDRSRKNQF